MVLRAGRPASTIDRAMAVIQSAPIAGDPVARESRLRMRQAAIALLAAVCLIAGGVIQSTGQPKVGELTVELISINSHAAAQVIGGVVTALGFLGLALTLNFLFLASRARRPESAVATRWCALVGGVLAAVGGAASAVVLATKAHDFVSSGSQTYLEANKLVSTP